MEQQLNEKFLQAASSGKIEEAVEALQGGAQLNAKSLKGNNALFLAATRNQFEFFDWLLEVTQKGVSIDVNNKNNTNDTLLLEVVRNKADASFIEKLIEKGAIVDLPSRDGVTALLQACANGDVETATVLLNNKANPNLFVTENKTTPFLMSVAEGNFDLVKLLLSHGANVNELDTFGRNALISGLFKSTAYMRDYEKQEHKELLDFLVDSGLDLDYVGKSGVTAIWLSTLMGFDDLSKKMIDKGVNVDRWHQLSPTSGKHAVIHTVCKTGNPELVELVLANGGKLSEKDEAGNSAESYGFMNHNLYEILLKYNADVNAKLYLESPDPNKPKTEIPVFAQVVSGGDTNFSIIEEMVKRGAKFTDIENDRFDPILISIISSAPKTLELLLNQKNVDVNKMVNIDEKGDSLSYLSVLCADMNSKKLSGALEQKQYLQSLLNAKKENEKNGVISSAIDEEEFKQIEKAVGSLEEIAESINLNKKKIFNLLIEKGADIEQVNEAGKTAIFYCKDVIHAQWLQEKGANIFHTCENGNNPLTQSILTGNKELIDYYKSQYTKTENLDNMYYRMAFEDESFFAELVSQKTFLKGILHFAGGQELAEAFKPPKGEEVKRQNITNINYQDEDGNSALLVACANNIPFLASLYYTLGAEVNLSNKLGETSIMHAIATKNTGLVEFLVKNGADCKAQTKEGKTVLDFAIEADNLAILKIINPPKKEPETKRPKP